MRKRDSVEGRWRSECEGRRDDEEHGWDSDEGRGGSAMKAGGDGVEGRRRSEGGSTKADL